MTGCESDIQSLVGEHDGDAKQLATWCVILKKELSAKKLECRELRTKFDKASRDLDICNRILNKKEKQLENITEVLANTREDLKHSENQCSSLKNKLEKLKSSHSNSDLITDGISVDRLVAESPAPLVSRKRPRLSSPINGEIDFESADLDTSGELCPVSENITTSSTKITIKTATAVKKVHKPAKPIHDISNMPGISKMNLFKKRGVAEGFSNFRKGYSGLGGHTSFTQPSKLRMAPPVAKGTTKPNKPQVNQKNSKKLPPLPTLDTFVTID